MKVIETDKDVRKRLEKKKNENEITNEDIVKNRKIKLINQVLTYKLKSGRLGCINRDVNACKNMLKITNHIIKYGDPLNYTRKNGEEIAKEQAYKNSEQEYKNQEKAYKEELKNEKRRREENRKAFA